MRILFWSDLFWPYIGGGEIFGAKLLRALKEKHDFAVVTTLQDVPDLPAEDSYYGVPVYRFPFYTAVAGHDMGEIIRTRRRVAELKRNFAPELIHLHNFGPSILFHLETSAAHPAPVLFTVQLELSPYKNDGVQTLLRKTLRSADWVTAVSSDTLEQVRQRAPETTARSSVIFNSLEPPSLSPADLPKDPPKLLCLGRLHAQKGFDVALAAFPEVINRFPKARLLIAGDGLERPELERQALELNLTANVDFIGWVAPDKVTALINTATMVIVPSRWEGLPLVALEAASMARPIVATRISGLSEIVLDKQTGLLVDPEDTAGLAEAIAFLLAHPEAAVQMGRAGRSRVQELFSWEHCVEAYNDLYRKLANQPSCAER